MPMTAAGVRTLFAAGRAAGSGILVRLRTRSGAADGRAHAHADILQIDGAGLADIVGLARDLLRVLVIRCSGDVRAVGDDVQDDLDHAKDDAAEGSDV